MEPEGDDRGGQVQRRRNGMGGLEIKNPEPGGDGQHGHEEGADVGRRECGKGRSDDGEKKQWMVWKMSQDKVETIQ